MGRVRVERRSVQESESRRANGPDWDRYADEYQATHGAFLGDAGFVWGPEGLTEEAATTKNSRPITMNATEMPPTITPASAMPSPSSPVSRICRRATRPSTRLTGVNTKMKTSARIAMVLVGRR